MAINRGTEFKKGLHAGVSIAIGYVPIALTFGLIAKTSDLTLGETVMMSMIVFAGAAQYMSLSLLTLGTGVIEIILTTFIVNIRHFLMSAALNEKVEADRVFNRILYSYGITDETFSVAATKQDTITTGYMFGLNFIAYASWVVCSGLGFLIGSGLPQTLQESMSIALYAMFVGLLVPSMKTGVKVVFLAVLGASFNSVFTLMELLSTGWSIVTATLLSAVLVESIEMMKMRWRANGDE
ncbi:AzlC family ABC transporter permease [Bacillus sp. B15-48]|uniref:AzlC family ABC transporter permease n=1 Tax=Bacillus sp. B15-48 TaxID=1548601 RepID=UPI00193FFEB1|nr:AzlC family ABC transporter permease [Bacillus sp. B15-48]MBM4764185.1 branched-chain amino acid ABC transporter permease [Bacillus sp. B15-48]